MDWKLEDLSTRAMPLPLRDCAGGHSGLNNGEVFPLLQPGALGYAFSAPGVLYRA